MARTRHDTDSDEYLWDLERALERRAGDLAVFLIYDRPGRADERPGLARTYFAERCVSDKQLDEMIDAFRSIGAYVELFEGERPFITALADGRIERMQQPLKVAYNGINWGTASDGFKAGRKSLIPILADSYGLICVNSDAYACALTLHKFHSFLILNALGVRSPRTWQFRPQFGWVGARPSDGTRVIAKSTYEASSVGVTDASVFIVDTTCEDRVASIAERIGQPVTVQEFVRGKEICVPVLSCPKALVTPPMEAVMARAPGDPDAVMTINDTLQNGAVSHHPFKGSTTLNEELQNAALKVFSIFELEGLTRIDFRVDEHDLPWAFDVAIDPGVGLKSSAFLSLSELGFDYPSFLRLVVGATLITRGLISL